MRELDFPFHHGDVTNQSQKLRFRKAEELLQSSMAGLTQSTLPQAPVLSVSNETERQSGRMKILLSRAAQALEAVSFRLMQVRFRELGEQKAIGPSQTFQNHIF